MVPGDNGGKGEGGQEARQDADGGAAVAYVENLLGFAEAFMAVTLDGDVEAARVGTGFFDPDVDAQGPDAGDGSGGVGTVEEVGDGGNTVGEATEDDRPVGYALIAGGLDLSLDGLSRGYLVGQGYEAPFLSSPVSRS